MISYLFQKSVFFSINPGVSDTY